MYENRPLILISNDDGVNAKGIRVLTDVLRDIADIIVMAPDGPRSGYSCAITSVSPLRFSKVREEEGVTVYQCSGTPTDCIKIALHEVVPRRPDLVVGGINHGDNSSVNVHYSGTMGVVLEGCLKGMPAIGFSLCDHAADADFSPLIPYIRKITQEVLEHGLPAGTCLNVNFPKLPSFKGVKVCRQTKGEWSNEWQKCTHPRGGHYYWLTGSFLNAEVDADDTDHWAMNHGYAAITPVQIDMTAYTLFDEMKSWNLEV